jgi:phosphoribosylformylglycinamidine cyclo-ligase
MKPVEITQPAHEQSATLSYEQSGVNYDLIDPLKVAAQRAAAATGAHLAAHGFSEVTASRGESAYVVDVGPFYIASIVECLGSKALVADEMHRLTGKSYYDSIAQDTIAMAINDLITVGATPLVVQAYWGAGGSDCSPDAQRAQALVAAGSAPAMCAASPGAAARRRPLAGIVEPGRIDLAASCTGLINPKERLSVGDRLAARRRDRAARIERHPCQWPEPGAQACRAAAARLPDRGVARLGYGEALLAPTVLYSPVTEALYKAGITPHYCANITGHGWRKLLRHPAEHRSASTPCPTCRRC